MIDIERDVAIEMPCAECGGVFRVTLGQVVLAKEGMRHECLARSENECPGMYFAGLIDTAVLETLMNAWREVQEQARREGGELVVRMADQVEAQAS